MCGISRVAGCGGGWGRDSFGSMSGGPPARALECARPTPSGSRIPCGTQPIKVSASVHQRAITNRSRRTLTHVTAKNARTTSKMSLRARLNTWRNCRSSGHRQRKPPACGGFQGSTEGGEWSTRGVCLTLEPSEKTPHGPRHQRGWSPVTVTPSIGHTYSSPASQMWSKPRKPPCGRVRRATPRTASCPSGAFHGGVVVTLRSPVRAVRSAPDAIHRS